MGVSWGFCADQALWVWVAGLTWNGAAEVDCTKLTLSTSVITVAAAAQVRSRYRFEKVVMVISLGGVGWVWLFGLRKACLAVFLGDVL
jgi:hypothetical protein